MTSVLRWQLNPAEPFFSLFFLHRICTQNMFLVNYLISYLHNAIQCLRWEAESLACFTKRQFCLPVSLGELARRRYLRRPLLISITYVCLCTKICKYRPTQKHKTFQHCHLVKPFRNMSLQNKYRKAQIHTHKVTEHILQRYIMFKVRTK